MSDCCAPRRPDGPRDLTGIVERAPWRTVLVTIPQDRRFRMGSDDPAGFMDDGEGPVREVAVSSFSIAPTTVTNAQFESFVQATGYQTQAERFGWSYVFHLLATPTTARHAIGSAGPAPWWLAIPGADWRHPEGPDSSVAERPSHPVVHVSWNDAHAYCSWARVELPTEAQWEYAARGGLDQRRYPWGDQLMLNGRHQCNIWQGTFPATNTAADGFVGTAPVRSFAPNGYGLYEVAGNVWEWCADWWGTDHDGKAPLQDPTGPAAGMARVMRGGSYLCHDSYCNRYRVAARTSNSPDSSTGNLGFRVAENGPFAAPSVEKAVASVGEATHAD